MKTRLNDFRDKVKTGITGCLIAIYLKHNNSVMPNLSKGEDFKVKGNELGSSIHINQFRVSCDFNLYFEYEEGAMEFEWTEVSTDELVDICEVLVKYCNENQLD